MGRNTTDANDDENDKSSEKETKDDCESSSDSDLDEEEYVVEKILKMRTTKKGKVQCKIFYVSLKLLLLHVFHSITIKIYLNGKAFLIVKIHG